ncbi:MULTISPECIES: OsmC family protein [Bacillales]|uniref:OsmC family protein n=1 Tax=Bacillales TaxID=1385 RepID=UPI0003454CC7|nr:MULTISPECIES: OsmC family protein [Bacillales]KMZ43792.1 osmotically inducible protein C [Bacillus sp. FJAT-27238]NQF13478.1 OsmC family protein [Brevibacillus sp. HB1.3]OUQ85200.1 osmotically inducible protein C [Brevibacillus brevis]UIO42271.1 OsmC family protein [Brevibacillus brevis]WGV59805.1 OsmC family protein [Brevibacillus brevis]
MEFQAKENGFVTQLSYGELHVSGDEQYGFRPYQLLVSSIAVCSGGVLRKVLDKMRMPCTDMKVTADVQRNEAEANRVEKIHLHFIISGENMKEEKVQKAIEAASKNCPMVQSVKGSIVVTESFELVS